MKYKIMWEIDAEGAEPLDAVLEAESALAGQIQAGILGQGGGVFLWQNLDTKEQGSIDLEELRHEGAYESLEDRLRRYM